MKLLGTLEPIYSRRDLNGNCYWAFRYTDHETGTVVNGTISGGESNVTCAANHLPGGYAACNTLPARELPVREFNRLTKPWHYAACRPEAIAQYILRAIEAARTDTATAMAKYPSVND